jgi:signal transduction histidine kinase
VRNMSLEFREFREISLFDGTGNVSASSAVGTPRLLSSPFLKKALDEVRAGRSFISDVFITNELTPALIAAFPLVRLGEVTSIVAAEIDLLHMWRLVGSIRIGKHGYINIVLPDGKLIASGSGELKKLVLQEKEYPDIELLRREVAENTAGDPYGIRTDVSGRLLVSAVAMPKPLSWIAVVEQPESEAYALVRHMSWQLAGLAALFIVLACLVGLFGVRWQILQPIRTLIRGTRSIAGGNLQHRVKISRFDEFGELARSFNRMTGDIAQMQDNIRHSERMAMFGRIASGLVHDLKHPVASIESASRLMDEMYEDPEYRETFRRTVDREFEKINAFLENLHTLTHDIPYRPTRLKVRPLLENIAETFEAEAKKRDVAVLLNIPGGDEDIYADKMSATRALSNIIVNGIQSMDAGGELNIAVDGITDESGNWLRIAITDQGKGVPPERLKTIFGDFVTTKHRGLGLGLALTKRILDQHGAKVNVKSELDVGTTFEILFPKPS